jgi:hypothetical protein
MNPQDALLQSRTHLWADYRSESRGRPMRRKGGPTSAPFGSAARADVDQAIKPDVILLDPLSQNVFAQVGLVNANQLLPGYWYGLPMADESLRITMFLRLGGVYNRRRRQ